MWYPPNTLGPRAGISVVGQLNSTDGKALPTVSNPEAHSGRFIVSVGEVSVSGQRPPR
ncbi:MAG: hypothetical protein R3A52_03150 [Polyangiales bacterium]